MCEVKIQDTTIIGLTLQIFIRPPPQENDFLRVLTLRRMHDKEVVITVIPKIKKLLS
jgi:hypothetical protein